MNMSIFPQQVLNGTRSKEEISLQLSGSPLIAVHLAQIYSEPLFPDAFVSSTSSLARLENIPRIPTRTFLFPKG